VRAGRGGWRLGDGALGLVVGLSSPLNLIFILALLPQFVGLGRLDAGSVALASAAMLLGGVLPLIAASIFSAHMLGTRPEAMRHLTRLCGGAILCFAGLAMMGGT
jgi:threonine/homoserine/homoserine lactone efflux protein